MLELVLIIVILGILATAATVRYLDITKEARESADREVVAAVREGIATYRMESALQDRTPSVPSELDTAGAGNAVSRAPLFDKVLKVGVSGDGWAKTGKHAYRTPSGKAYVYDPEAGTFGEKGTAGEEVAEPPPLTSLGSTFDEITGAMTDLIRKYQAENGRFPRSWGDYVFTDIGLDPDEWSGKPVDGLIYSPVGNRISVKPAGGHMITVAASDGEERKLLPSYNWYLVCDMNTGTWYYHSIAGGNEIDISTLQVVTAGEP